MSFKRTTVSVFPISPLKHLCCCLRSDRRLVKHKWWLLEKSRSRWDPEREPTQQPQASHQLKQCSSNCEETAVFSATTCLRGLLLFSLTKQLFIIKWGHCQMLILHPSKERHTHKPPNTHTHKWSLTCQSKLDSSSSELCYGKLSQKLL